MITVCSIFSNSVPYLGRYFKQINDLRERYDLRLVLGEGDSRDHTYDELQSYLQPEDALLQHHHGGPVFGSVDSPQRWEQIASIVAPVVRAACGFQPQAVVWVESDLVWETRVMAQLIDTALDGRVVAPMVFAANSERFYDTWGFRMDGQHFYAHPPYQPKESRREGNFVKIDSCGSCFATDQLKTLKAWSGHWPYRAAGELWLDTSVCVEHP